MAIFKFIIDIFLFIIEIFIMIFKTLQKTFSYLFTKKSKEKIIKPKVNNSNLDLIEEAKQIITNEADTNQSKVEELTTTTNNSSNNRNTAPDPLDNKEHLLEDEYKKLQLDLTELNVEKKLIKNIKPKSSLSWLLKFPLYCLSFKWIFNLKFWIVAIILISICIVYVLWDLPNYKTLNEYNPSTVSRVYSEDGYILSELARQNRSFISIDNIPPAIKNAFISAEDKNFYTNSGFDYKGIARAVINDILRVFDGERDLMGASTITQQVVKNLLLTQDRTIVRKLKEMVLTVKLEQHFSKDRILELYLNEIYLGKGSYGVAAAALNYFNKSLYSLTLPEIAFLAILPRSPNGYNPVSNYNASKARRDWVIGRMLANNYITEEQASEAIKTPIVLSPRTNLATDYSGYAAEEVRKKLFNIVTSNTVYNKGLIVKTTINNSLQKYAHDALRNGIIHYDKKQGYRGKVDNIKLNITENTLNSNDFSWLTKLKSSTKAMYYQDKIDDWKIGTVLNITKNTLQVGLLNKQIITLNLKDNTWAFPNPKVYNITDASKIKTKLADFNSILQLGDVVIVSNNQVKSTQVWQLEQIPKANGAILVMNPLNGHILAMQGGFSYDLSKFNRAIQAYRQPGSPFKAFVYLTALEHGMTPATQVLDAPFTSISDNNIWKPKNDQGKYAGYVTMRNALEHSRNLATIRIASIVKLNNISILAKQFGIYDDNLSSLADAIGAKETTLYRMVRGYSVIANGGRAVNPVLIDSIQDNNGNFIFKNDTRTCEDCKDVAWNNQSVPTLPSNSEQIVDPRNDYLLINILKGVVDRGTAARAKLNGFDIAGKTGTTNDDKDIWFFGFTPQIVVGIYIGEDIPVSLGNNVSASNTAVPIFHDFASKALPSMYDKIPFRIPDGIVMRWIDIKTGQLVTENDPNAFLETFRDDDVPKKNDQNVVGGDNNDNSGLY